MSSPQRRWSVANAALLVTALTLVSTLLGFVRDVVIAAVFGASPELDSYLAAQGLLNIIIALVAGAMARSSVPVTSREAAGETDRCAGHRGFDTAFTITVLVLGVLGILMAIFAGPVTTAIAPGFDGPQAELTAQLTRILLVATVLVAGTNLFASLAQVHGRFGWSALEGVPFNIVMIATAGLFGPRYGISALAVGFVVGSAARLLLQLIPLRAARVRLRPRLEVSDPGFREIARLMPAMLVGSALGNVNTMVDRAVGSTLADGTITALSYAWRLIDLPQTLLVASLLVPLYPALGAAAKDRAEVRRLVGRGLALIITVLTPISVVLIIAAKPAVAIVFGYGAFDSDAVAQTADAMVWYVPALLALSIRLLMVRASYAVGDSRTPVTIGVFAMVLNLAGDLLLAPVMGAAGIALATSISVGAAAVLNTWLLRRRHDGVALRPAAGLLGRATGLAVASSGAGWAARHVTDDLPALVSALAIGLAVVGVYAAGLVMLRSPELAVFRDALRQVRRGRRRPRG
ncbi:murein biosynthesis integral membrane protein MurJ [Tessaracoccus flavus]|uniref:Lipid II flippase n=1 Tax=Tessaracoccus flavus TaxID=1610493 RepID=A0A1Q2CGW8_9ACTN|nr:murein biosynthesis integral membrane protein MurJ [Tessaracoccus flavus]AQP45362.1 murein biosynthesis integral membrane protein MurJ [Tessaracoccus flavus]SDY94045.1 putative peptidoglycan lipid II flippase [Tessaracoccus flavus]